MSRLKLLFRYLAALAFTFCFFNYRQFGEFYSNVFDRLEFIGPTRLNRTISENLSSTHGSNETSGEIPKLKFFLVAPPEYTIHLLSNATKRDLASTYYRTHLNEESAELWLHRGFARMKKAQVKDPRKADVILVAGYFHLNLGMSRMGGGKKKSPIVHLSLQETYRSQLTKLNETVPDIKSKPHLLLIPTWNPSVSMDIGVKPMVHTLEEDGYTNLWSVGFERNKMWQGVPFERILPIPYVVRPGELSSNFQSFQVPKRHNFVFYVGDYRRNAGGWAGCHRDKMILPLRNASNMDLRLVSKKNRIEQQEYNRLIQTSDYCLILCGDTPSSRSLTSAMTSNCIPIRVGSRLRGLCDPPCHRGFGWKPTGAEYPHLPYPEIIDWKTFPEINEQDFTDNGAAVLQDLFATMDEDRKKTIRDTMNATKSGWMYGWGDPVTSARLGDASFYIWRSFKAMLTRR